MKTIPDFENLEIFSFKGLEKYIDKMIRLSKKNKDLDVYEDFKSIKRGLNVAKHFFLYKIKKWNKIIDFSNPIDESWVNALIILKGIFRSELAKEKRKQWRKSGR